MFLIASVILFAIFATNVFLGAFGGTQFMGDVGELLVLLSASLTFVVVTLQREAAEKTPK